MQFAMTDVMKVATRQLGRGGLDLLRTEPWDSGSYFIAGVGGYVSGLGSRVPWREVREDLVGLSAERVGGGVIKDVDGKVARSERRQIDTIIAIEWARTDLDSAADWFLDELNWEGFDTTDVDRTTD